MNAPRPNFTLKGEIRDYWSDRAATFDESALHKIEDRHGMPEWHRLLRGALGLGSKGRLDGWQALDIACGTGEISRVLTGLTQSGSWRTCRRPALRKCALCQSLGSTGKECAACGWPSVSGRPRAAASRWSRREGLDTRPIRR